MTKRNLLMLLFLCLALPIMAQQQGPKPGRQFSPQKFEADMRAFITKEANFTAAEATTFFQLFNEMHERKRAAFDEMRKMQKNKPAADKACAENIRKRDKLDIELKQIEQRYHNKMLNVLPAGKVYDAINAEDRFHRQALKRATHRPDGGR